MHEGEGVGEGLLIKLRGDRVTVQLLGMRDTLTLERQVKLQFCEFKTDMHDKITQARIRNFFIAFQNLKLK
jgi:hypothetical protein